MAFLSLIDVFKTSKLASKEALKDFISEDRVGTLTGVVKGADIDVLAKGFPIFEDEFSLSNKSLTFGRFRKSSNMESSSLKQEI